MPSTPSDATPATSQANGSNMTIDQGNVGGAPVDAATDVGI